jgi:LysM domain
VTHVPAGAIADQARKHLDEAGPVDTCVSNGPERWARELGLPTLGTGSVNEYVRLAQAGRHGYRYHEGTAGLSRGHVGVWDPQVLGDPNGRHVCVVDDVEGSQWRGIGSGTPSGKVARQPGSGGMNPKGVLVGYVVLPTETAAAAAPPAPSTGPKPAAAAPSADDVHTVKRGEYLALIARQHHTTVKAILRANPALPSRRSADFHIARADLILVGQKIRLP